MANALNADLRGRVIVLPASSLKPEYAALEQRLFLVKGGFGANPDTRGGMFYGQWLADGPDSPSDSLRHHPIERFASDEEVAAAAKQFSWSIDQLHPQPK